MGRDHTYKLFNVEWFNGPVRRNCEMSIQQRAGNLVMRAPCWRHALNTVFRADLGYIIDRPISTRILPHLLEQGLLFCQLDALAVVPMRPF